MNLYSLQFLPRIKLKFCQFLGMASELALQELTERLQSVDRKMDRLEDLLKRIHRNQSLKRVVAAQKKSLSNFDKNSVQKQSSPRKKLQKSKVILNKKPELSVVGSFKRTFEPSAEKETAKKKDVFQKSILMLACEKETIAEVKDYFGSKVKVMAVSDLDKLPESFAGEMLAVFYDRRLMGDEKSLKRLRLLREQLATSKWIGLSNYLTLNLAQAAEAPDFSQEQKDALINLPIHKDSLAEIFDVTSYVAFS